MMATLAPEKYVPFAVYMIGFLVFMAGVVWAAVVVGVPQIYITLGAVVLIVLGVIVALTRSRTHRRGRGPDPFH